MGNIVVTGAAGFIGANILRSVTRDKVHSVIAVDRLSNDERWKYLIGEYLADYVDADDLEEVLSSASTPSIDAVVHMGACSSTTEADAHYLMKNNFDYSKMLFEWCARKQVPFIYASSAATYGDGSRGYSDDEATLDKLSPLNMYGYSKHLFDQWQLLQQERPPQVVGLKFFNVYGPYESHKGKMASVVFHAYNQIRASGTVKLFKSYRPDFADGEQRRDFVSVEDVAEVVSFFLDNTEVQGIFNVGTGSSRTFNDLARAVFNSLGQEPVIEYVEMPEVLRAKYQYFTEANISRLVSSGYVRQFYTLEEGISRYVRFLVGEGGL